MLVMKFNRSNQYFSTYNIYDRQHRLVGIIEYHDKHVSKPYFVGWKIVDSKWETQSFSTIADAQYYSVGQLV